MSADRQTQPFGLATLTMLVIASMIGAGVFTTSGFTLAAVGSPTRVMLCWLIGAAIAFCGAVAYGRLAQLMPESGGEYLYLSRNVHPLAGFLAGWVSLTAGFSGAIATAAVAFESYVIPAAVRPPGLPQDILAVGLVLLCGLAHGLQVRAGVVFQNLVVTLKLVALAAFLAVVAVQLPTHNWHWQPLSNAAQDGWSIVTAAAISVVWISLSFAGFNAAVYVASESTQARRTVPAALLLGTVLVSGLYLLLNLIFVTSTAADRLAGQPDVAAIAAASLGGQVLETLIRVTIALGLASSVSGMVMSGPRVYARMADDGTFPRLFGRDQAGTRRGVALQTVLAVALILLSRALVTAGWLESPLLGLLSYLGTTLSLTSACCVATLFSRRVRRHSDSDMSGVQAVSAAVYVAATLISIILMMFSGETPVQGLWHLTGTAATAVTGLLAWAIFRHHRNRN